MTFTTTSLRIASGIVVWALHFGLLYASTALACARDTPGVLPWIIGLGTLLAVLACVLIIRRSWRAQPRPSLRALIDANADDPSGSQEFEHWLTIGTAALALLAILWQALPALLVAPCG